jgi:hypothetical protein
MAKFGLDNHGTTTERLWFRHMGVMDVTGGGGMGALQSWHGKLAWLPGKAAPGGVVLRNVRNKNARIG